MTQWGGVQMSTASTLGTTESESDDATHGNTDDMEEEVMGASSSLLC